MGKVVRQLKQVLKEGTLKKLFDKYISMLEFMSFHQFSKIWQMKQFNLSKQNLRKGQIILVHDFSQNIILYAQGELQGAHWDHEQITVHPTVCFYVCNNGFLVREEVIHISKERKHDHHGVDIFRDKMLAHLLSEGVRIDKLIEWTDNAGNQYKSCGEFLVTSCEKCPTSHHFFGAQHRKSPADRAGAYYKHFVRKTVKTGKIVLLDSDDLVRISMIDYENQERCGPNSLCTHQ